MRSFLIATCAMLTIVGCSGQDRSAPDPADTQPPDAAVAELSDNDRWLAEKLFEDQTCAMCHGPESEGTSLGPVLEKLTPYWDEARLATYLQDPAAFAEANPDFDRRRTEEYSMEMPAYDTLQDSDRRLLARWLLQR